MSGLIKGHFVFVLMAIAAGFWGPVNAFLLKQIIEDGSHDALLQQGGHYAKMWQMQAGGFMPMHQKLV